MSTVYSYQEYPKYVPGPDGPTIVENAEAEQRVRRARARHIGRVRANVVQASRADAFAIEIGPVIDAIRAEGTTSLRGIARALNRRGIASPRGGRWQASQLQRLLHRIERAASEGVAAG
jgi:hypothetical protein